MTCKKHFFYNYFGFFMYVISVYDPVKKLIFSEILVELFLYLVVLPLKEIRQELESILFCLKFKKQEIKAFRPNFSDSLFVSSRFSRENSYLLQSHLLIVISVQLWFCALLLIRFILGLSYFGTLEKIL